MRPADKWFKFLDEHPTYVVKAEKIGHRKTKFTAAQVKSAHAKKAQAQVIVMDFNEFPDPAQMMADWHSLILQTGRTPRPDGIYIPINGAEAEENAE